MSRQFVSLGNFNLLPSISLWSRDGEDRLKAQVQEVKEQYTSLPSERGNTQENDSRLYWTNPAMAICPTGTVTIDKPSNPKDMQESAASHTNNPFVHDVTNPDHVGQECQSLCPLKRVSFACPDVFDNGACGDNLNASSNVPPYPNDQPEVHLLVPRSHSDTSKKVLAALGLSWEYRPVAQHKYQTFNKETTKTMLQRKARNVNSLRAKYNLTQNACVGGQLKHAESGMSTRAALLEKQNIKMQKEHEDRQNTTSSSLPGRRENISKPSELSEGHSDCEDAEVSTSSHQPSDPTPSDQSLNPKNSNTVQEKSEKSYPRPRFPNVLEKKEKHSLAFELLKETYMGKTHNKKRTQNSAALGEKSDCCRDASLLQTTECDEPVLEKKTGHFDDAKQTVTLRQPGDSSCTGVTKHHLAEKTNADIVKDRNNIVILTVSHEDCNAELLNQRLKEECTTNYPPGCKANFPQIQTPRQNQTHLYEHMELNQIQDRHGKKSHFKKRLPILSMKERVKTVKRHLTTSNTTSVVSQTQVVIFNQKDALKHDIHKPVGKGEEITAERTKSSPYYAGQGWYDPDPEDESEPEDETSLSTEENVTPSAPSKSSRYEANKRTCIQKSRSSPLHLALTQSFSRKCRSPTKSKNTHHNKLKALQNGEHPNSSTPKTNLQDGKPMCTTPVKQREANCGKRICTTPVKQGKASEMLRTYTRRNMSEKNKLSSFEEERKKVKAQILSLLEKTQKAATKSKGQGIQLEEASTVRHVVTHNNTAANLQALIADNSSEVVVLSVDTLASGQDPFDCPNPSHNLSYRDADNTGSDVYSQKDADSRGSDVHSQRYADNTRSNVYSKGNTDNDKKVNLSYKKYNFRRLMLGLPTQKVNSDLQDRCLYGLNSQRNLQVHQLSTQSIGHTTTSLESNFPYQIQDSNLESSSLLQSERSPGATPLLLEDPVSVNPLQSEGLTPNKENLCHWVLGNNFPNVSLENDTSVKPVNTCVLHKDSKLYFLENLHKITVNSSSLGHNGDESDEFVPNNHNPHIKASYFSDLSLPAVTSLDIISAPKVSSPLHIGVTPSVSPPAGLATPLETVTSLSMSSPHAANTLNVSSQVDDMGTLSMSSSEDVVDTLSISSPVDAVDTLSISSPVDAVDTLSVSSVDENLDTLNVTYQPCQ